jgi:hypothetical protein
LLPWSHGPAHAKGLLALDRTCDPTTVPLLYSALLRMGGGFFSHASPQEGVEKESRGEGQLGIGLPRIQWNSMYIEWDYDYLHHWMALPGVHKDTRILQREHRLAPSFIFFLSSRWTLGLFGFYSWVLQGKKWATEENTHSEVSHSESFYPWVAYAWSAYTQSIFYGIFKKKLNEEDHWLSYQTWIPKEKRSSFGLLQEFFWQQQYVTLQGERRYFRCNDFWQDRKEDWLGLYAELRRSTLEVPLWVGWTRKEYVFSRIRMQRSEWQRSRPVFDSRKGTHMMGSVGVRWNFRSFWWMQGEVRSTYDTMNESHSLIVQLSLSGSLGRALKKRDRREMLLNPFSYSF